MLLFLAPGCQSHRTRMARVVRPGSRSVRHAGDDRFMYFAFQVNLLGFASFSALSGSFLYKKTAGKV